MKYPSLGLTELQFWRIVCGQNPQRGDKERVQMPHLCPYLPPVLRLTLIPALGSSDLAKICPAVHLRYFIEMRNHERPGKITCARSGIGQDRNDVILIIITQSSTCRPFFASLFLWIGIKLVRFKTMGQWSYDSVPDSHCSSRCGWVTAKCNGKS